MNMFGGMAARIMCVMLVLLFVCNGSLLKIDKGEFQLEMHHILEHIIQTRQKSIACDSMGILSANACKQSC